MKPLQQTEHRAGSWEQLTAGIPPTSKELSMEGDLPLAAAIINGDFVYPIRM